MQIRRYGYTPPGLILSRAKERQCACGAVFHTSCPSRRRCDACRELQAEKVKAKNNAKWSARKKAERMRSREAAGLSPERPKS